MKDSDLQSYLDSLTIWAESKGYYINFEKNGDDCICSVSKIIEINSSASLRDQVYCLLHECGHVAIYEFGSFWNYKSKPVYMYSKLPSEHADKKFRDTYRVYTVVEEAEAWKRGYKLAERLGIPIDPQEWEEHMLDALGKYLDWSAS